MDLSSIFDIFRNRPKAAVPPPGSPDIAPAIAPPLTQYPTQADAEYAQDYGFGGMNAPYVQGQTARVIGVPRRGQFVPGSLTGSLSRGVIQDVVTDELSRNVDLTNPANAVIKDKLGTTIAQAALAANRMPIAHLGFDPTYMSFDTMRPEGDIAVAGAYTHDVLDPTNRSKDAAFSTLSKRDPSTPVHEFMHRGMQTLRTDPALADVFKRLPDEESVVRYLMATQGGNPERGAGNAGDRQIDAAMKMFAGGRHDKDLATLERAAQDAWAKRRPGGPR